VMRGEVGVKVPDNGNPECLTHGFLIVKRISGAEVNAVVHRHPRLVSKEYNEM
jgi:hypothetical protein